MAGSGISDGNHLIADALHILPKLPILLKEDES